MTIRKGRPGQGGPRDPQPADRDQSRRQPRQPARERPETIDQARRWDAQRSRAIAFGLCDRCAAQYAWGLQIGFAHSHPPCDHCAQVLGRVVGEARPNGWTNLRLAEVGSFPAGDLPRAHRSRSATPEKYREGFGTCGCRACWTGFATCHCSGCHHTLTAESAFAQHRLRGRCQDPEARGLVKVTRTHWTGWGQPTQRDRFDHTRG